MKRITLTTVGRLDECLLLSYRTPLQTVRRLVPDCMELLTLDGWAFWNVVACKVRDMRPAGIPACFGVTYRHVAYRLYVKARSADGQSLRGLYFVRSDADSGLVGRFGNALTDLRFHPADVELSTHGDVLTLAVQGRAPSAGDGVPDGAHAPAVVGDAADALVRVETSDAAAAAAENSLGPGSPFRSAADAAKFLTYCPLGISTDPDGRWLKLTEVVRDESAWRERAVRVVESHFRLFERLGLDDVHLERATRLTAPVDYRWRIGRRLAVARQQLPWRIARPAPERRAAA